MDPGADTTWRQVPLDGLVELRVHGVGGTPAEEMLDDPHPVQVSGDQIAGVMRSPGDHTVLGRHVEAYSWGGLTGRSQVRALWLLVLPLALVNMAGWMNPDRTDGVHRALVRLIGVAITALYVLFVAAITMDFAAYQCAGAPGCMTAGWPLIGIDGAFHSPARRVVIGAHGPLLLVLTLAVLTRTSRRRYESWRPEGPVADPDRNPPNENGSSPATCGLTDPEFWSGQGYAGRLAHVHHFTGLTLVALLLATTAQSLTESPVAPWLVMFCAVALLLAVPLSLGSRVRSKLPTRWLVPAGMVLVVATATAAWTGVPNGPGGRPLPGILLTFDAVLAVLYAAVLLLLVVPAVRAAQTVLRRRSRPSAEPWRVRLRRRFTPFAVCVLVSFVTPAYLAGTALWVARWLGTSASIGQPDVAGAAIVYPQPYEALARGLLAVIVAGLITALVAGALASSRVGPDPWKRLVASWQRVPVLPGAVSARGDRIWRHGVRRALRIPAASLAALEWTIWALAALVTVSALAYSAYWLGALAGGQTGGYLDVELLATLPLPPLGLSTWVLTSLPLVSAIVMRQGLRQPSTRRRIAVAWDVTTFWPRSFHPLAPPSYAERAVPELQGRMHRIWAGGGRVLLLAHSQGAVLATAAVAGMPLGTAGLDRTAVVTYGNPVHRLYARHFPAYLDDTLVEALTARPASWHNFYRDTDYVGERLRPDVPDCGIDEYLPDPATDHHLPGDRHPEVRSHGEHGYRRQREFVRYVAQAVAALRGAPAVAARE